MKYELAAVKVEVVENGIVIETSDMSVQDGRRTHVFTDVGKAAVYLDNLFTQRRKAFVEHASKILQQPISAYSKDPTRRFDIE